MTTQSDAVPGWFRKRQEEDKDAEHANKQTGRPPQETSGTATGGGIETEPVVVWEAANRMEAQIVRGRLESEGIPAIIQGEAVGTIYGLTTGKLARTVVLAPAPLADKARQILETAVDWSDWDDEAPSDETLTDKAQDEAQDEAQDDEERDHAQDS
jgi:hypothetical protein